MFMTRLDGSEILEANEKFLEIFSLARKEVIGKPSVIRWADPHQRDEMVHRLKAGGRVVDFECKMLNKNGEVRDCITSMNLDPDEGILNGSILDITDRKKGEINLQEKVEGLRRMATVVSDSNDAVIMHDFDGKILAWNRGAKETYGYSEAEALGKNVREIVAEPDREAALTLIKKIKQGEVVKSFELRRVTKDGRILDVWLTTTLLTDEKGKPVAIATTERDITDRKQAEKEIQTLARFPSENPYPVLRVARDGTLLYVNSNGKKLLPEWHLVEGQVVPPMLREVVSQSMKEGKTQLLNLEHSKRVYSFFISPIVASGYANAYGRDVTEQKQYQIDLQNSVIKLRNTVEGTIETIAMIVEARDPYTSGHQQRVAEISVAIAKDLGLTEEQIRGIYMAGLIHDLGKIQVPAEILSKPGQLTKLEFELIKTHPKVGFDLLKGIEFPWPIAQIIYQHHEREDGSGYPRKLKGDKILIEAKIISIADVIEAMSSHRPYRPALGIEVALDEIVKHKGTLYDTTIVASYLKVIKKGYKFSK